MKGMHLGSEQSPLKRYQHRNMFEYKMPTCPEQPITCGQGLRLEWAQHRCSNVSVSLTFIARWWQALEKLWSDMSQAGGSITTDISQDKDASKTTQTVAQLERNHTLVEGSSVEVN